MRIGIIGVGRMGAPIARHLSVRSEVRAFDLVPGAVHELGPAVSSAASARELAAVSDVLITVLPGAAEVRSALVEDGALDALPAGAIWLDLSSTDPRAVDELAALAAARGTDTVAAPMRGGPAEAASATLGFFVGGAPAAIDRIRPLLDALAAPGQIGVVGEAPGQANAVKLIANLLWFEQAVGVTEAMLLGRSLGIDPARLRSLLADSAGGSVFIDRHLPRLLDGDYMTDFGIDGVVEELRVLSELAAETDTPFASGDLALRLHREALTEFGPVGGELLAARVIELRAGRALDGSAVERRLDP